MSPEKLTQLHRQRKLVQEHLDWLDEQIEAAKKQATANTAESEPLPPSEPPRAPDADESTDTISTVDYQPDPQGVGTDARRGCLILFFAVLVLGALILTGIYLWKYRDRPLFLPEENHTQLDSGVSLRLHPFCENT